jgi:hypothetical protein
MIIWLASYPKSGNTLLRSMLSSYLFSEEGIFNFDQLKKIKQFPNKLTYESLGVDISDHNELIKNSIRVQEELNKGKSVGFLKTHNMLYNFKGKYPFTDYKNSLGVVYVVRDPRNVVLSYARHVDVSAKEAVKVVTKSVSHDVMLQGNWSQHYLSWKAFREKNRYLLIKYEDLISNREETFLKILKFLFKLRNINLVIDQNKLKNVINSTSFENLKKLEQQSGFTEPVKDKQGKKIVFFDKGVKRDWANSLDKDMTAEIEKTFNKEMIELGYL